MRDSSINDSGYRSVSTLAVLSFACGLVSFGSLLIPPVLVISIAGIVLAILAFRQFARRELAGLQLSQAGLFLSVSTFLSGVGLHTYWHIIEVPPGYERISFRHDIASKQGDASGGRLVVDPDVRALVGRHVSLRGYPLWISADEESPTFLLSLDGGEGVWGAPMRTSETVHVRLPAGETWKYTPGYLAVSGEFEIIESPDASFTDEKVVYQLKDAIIRPATSPFGEWEPHKGGC